MVILSEKNVSHYEKYDAESNFWPKNYLKEFGIAYRICFADASWYRVLLRICTKSAFEQFENRLQFLYIFEMRPWVENWPLAYLLKVRCGWCLIFLFRRSNLDFKKKNRIHSLIWLWMRWRNRMMVIVPEHERLFQVQNVFESNQNHSSQNRLNLKSKSKKAKQKVENIGIQIDRCHSPRRILRNTQLFTDWIIHIIICSRIQEVS